MGIIKLIRQAFANNFAGGGITLTRQALSDDYAMEVDDTITVPATGDILLILDATDSKFKKITRENYALTPAPIGGTTPLAGAFTTLSASAKATLAAIYGTSFTTNEGVGAVAGTGCTVVESGAGVLHRTTITLADVAVALSDDGAAAYGGLKIYDFPLGWIYFLGIVADIALTKSSAGVDDAFDGDVAFGTVIVDADTSPMSGVDEDLIPVTTTPQASSGATTADCQSTASEIAILDGHSAAKDININFMVDDADHDVAGTACNLICNGTVTITWVNLGDN